VAPIFIGQAVGALSHGSDDAYRNVGIYSILLLTSKVCAELQNISYLKVKQNAFVEIAELTFFHLHSLSFDWHVKKKLGTTMRSLDRGSAAADTIVSYLFMYLLPSLIECVVTLLVFYHHFDIPSLTALVFVCCGL
jgi:ABC-type transport system involved in Fe-S cluster assembly fused permease/ATPase subunit